MILKVTSKNMVGAEAVREQMRVAEMVAYLGALHDELPLGLSHTTPAVFT